MLVLSRRVNETIVIGSDIVITVTKARGTVGIGVQAPIGVRVMRGEIADDPKQRSSRGLPHRAQGDTRG
jgi:carbon storage regulator